MSTKSTKKKIKTIAPFILSGFVGGIITIIFFPAQKEIEQYYWNKQNTQIVNQRKLEKRLDLLDQLVVEYTRYNWCSIRAGVINRTQVIEEDPIVCYQDSSSKLMGLAVQIKYYYDEKVIAKFDEIAVLIQAYEDDIAAGNPDAESGRKLSDSVTETIKLMQERMLTGLK